MRAPGPPIPDYLENTYSWAYLHPWSLRVFERDWVVNLILWGNMKRLTQAVVDEVGQGPCAKTQQLACVYGDFSRALASELADRNAELDLVDVAPIQLMNARDKLAGHDNVRFVHNDATELAAADEEYDLSILFFLMHEQPEPARRATLAEALRVTRPGGRLIVVDYSAPNARLPLKWVMWPILHWLEPFALDLWRQPLTDFLPAGADVRLLQHRQFFGGLYQKAVFQRVS